MKKALYLLCSLVALNGCTLMAEDEIMEYELEEGQLAKQILYRGQTYTPDDLQDQDIQHWAIDSELAQEGIVAAFDSAEESIQYLSSKQLERMDDGVMPLSCDENAFFYDDPYYGGAYFYLLRGSRKSSLGDIGWNDRIHSLRTPSCPSVTVLYEDSNFGGKTISFSASSNVASLADYKISTFHSWRNKASSLKVVGNLYYGASNTSSALQNTTNQTVQLLAGQTIEVGTCNVTSSYGSGDTYLRLYNASGTQVKVNDDYCGLLSYLQYTAPTSGTYEIRAGCYSSSSCSGMVAYTWEAYPINLALQATATAQSTYSGYSASRVNDGDTNTTVGGAYSWTNAHKYGTNGYLPQWLQLDFGSTKSVREIRMYTSQGYEIKDYDIQYWNGSSWVTIVSVNGNTQVSRVHLFSTVSTSKIRVIGRRGPDNQYVYVRINELEVY